MKTGMSTACFFSRELNENALREIAKLNIKNAEIFFSAQMEYRPDFINELVRIQENEGLNIVSIHALPTQFEPQLFSTHPRQYEEAMGVFENVLQAARQLSASIYVFHGPVYLKIARKLNLNMEFVGERLTHLANLAQSYGVALCYENVHWCWYNSPGFATALKQHTHSDNLYFTLDMKQAAQSGFPVLEYMKDMGNKLRHVHVCDYKLDEERGIVPCLPFEGEANWEGIRNKLIEIGYDGYLMLEVYATNYGKYAELKDTYNQVHQYFTHSGSAVL